MGYSLEQILDLDRERALSHLCEASQVQSSYSFRVRWRGQKMAEFLVDNRSKISAEKVKILFNLLQEGGYILYPMATSDSDWTTYVKKILRRLVEEKSLVAKIERIGFPLCNAFAHECVEDACDAKQGLRDRDLRCALLSALLTPLRQTVGSCFATAPAILIQEQLPHKVVEDLTEILTKGQLSRIYGGRELVVPMSPSAGSGDLKKRLDPASAKHSPSLSLLLGDERPFQGKTAEEILSFYFDGEELRRAKARFVAFVDHPLLKVWEFTLASFSEIKMEFSKWHLYSSLGFHPNEVGGLGELIYKKLDETLQEENHSLEESHKRSITAAEQLRATERLLQQAGSEREGRRLSAEHQARLYQYHSEVDARETHQKNTEQLMGFFTFLLKEYEKAFPLFFQEIYDAEMGDIGGTDYSDSPAGFRLVYKHGRTQAGSWSFVRSSKDYVQALRGFFLRFESDLSQKIEWALGKELVAQLTVEISHHLQTDQFLLTAFQRMARLRGAVQLPRQVEELDSFPLKPWAYESGGTMDVLLKSYFCIEEKLSEEARKIESPLDLALFMIEQFKGRTLEGRILAQSPTHAFSLLPDQPLFKEACDSSLFPYSWVRDTVLIPMRLFYQSLLLSPFEQRTLSSLLQLPPLFSPAVLTPLEWRSLAPASPDLDSTLFSVLPLIDPVEWPRYAQEILKRLGMAGADSFLPIFNRYLTRVEAHHSLIEACRLFRQTGACGFDLHAAVANEMREFRLAPPEPLIFADSNWSKYWFAFLVNPGTEQLELWRCDAIGLFGKPMQEFRQYLDGSSEEPWKVYTRSFIK